MWFSEPHRLPEVLLPDWTRRDKQGKKSGHAYWIQYLQTSHNFLSQTLHTSNTVHFSQICSKSSILMSLLLDWKLPCKLQ